MTILHIDSAVTGSGSVSREFTAAIVATLAERSPGETIAYRDLVESPLPHFTLGETETGVLDEYLAANTVVIGAPLYNFGIASQLKAWIDRILMAGRTFRYTETGPEGLASHIRVIIAVTRGGFYDERSAARSAEHAETYLAAVFRFLGIDAEFVTADGLMVSPDQRAASLAQAHGQIKLL